MPLAEFVRLLSRRTGLKEDEVKHGVQAILATLGRSPDGADLQRALNQLPIEYRQLATTRA